MKCSITQSVQGWCHSQHEAEFLCTHSKNLHGCGFSRHNDQAGTDVVTHLNVPCFQQLQVGSCALQLVRCLLSTVDHAPVFGNNARVRDLHAQQATDSLLSTAATCGC